MIEAYALWIIGPAGCGKSTLSRSLGQRFEQALDQDREFERLLLAESIPLDFRLHQQNALARVNELRTIACHASWAVVPEWRRRHHNFSIETTGDKPDWLRQEVELNSQDGYTDLALLIDCSLDDCQQRNNSRPRVLPSAVISKGWHEFQDRLRSGAYDTIFQPQRLTVLRNPLGRVARDWLDHQMGSSGADQSARRQPSPTWDGTA